MIIILSPVLIILILILQFILIENEVYEKTFKVVVNSLSEKRQEEEWATFVIISEVILLASLLAMLMLCFSCSKEPEPLRVPVPVSQNPPMQVV